MKTRATVCHSLIMAGGISLLALATLAPAVLAQITTDPLRLVRFDKSRAESREAIDYKVVDTVLSSLVIDSGGTTAVRYSAIKGDGERVLTRLIEVFATIGVADLNPDEQLAYWLNLRALLVLRSAGQAFPSIRLEKVLAPGSAFSTTTLVTVDGVDLSLADIDAIILKRASTNPNIVYGLVLPVREAPAFPRKAFRGQSVNVMLAEAARSFINRSGGVKTTADIATVPQFLINHRNRLGSDDAALLSHIRGFASPKLGQKIALATRVTGDPRLSLNAFVERSFADVPHNSVGEAGGGGAAGS